MFINKKSAFTLIELVVVAIMIGILIMATTIYLDGSGERRKIIEGQGCASTLGGEIHNYLFYTLTSKKLKITDSQYESPDYYVIQLTGGDFDFCSSGHMCDTINFGYITGDEITNIQTYQTISSQKTCHQTKQRLKFYRSGDTDIKYILMNKGFSPKSNINTKTFYMKEAGGNNPSVGDIIIALCTDNSCTSTKDISKFSVDGRTQIISVNNCKFYQDDNPTKCKTREGCSIYNSENPTTCDQY